MFFTLIAIRNLHFSSPSCSLCLLLSLRMPKEKRNMDNDNLINDLYFIISI